MLSTTDPRRPLTGLLQDVASADRSPELLHVWWLGQAGFLLVNAGCHVVIDPYLSDTLATKYAGTATPHDRLHPVVVDPGALRFVDAVLATHHHTDHLDPGTLAPLLRAAPGALLVVPRAARRLALERAQVSSERIRELDAAEQVEVAGAHVRAVPAAHERIERDVNGNMLCLGYVIEVGPFRVLHTGDTVPYPGQAAWAGAVDVAILPINGRAVPGTPGNLDIDEAAALAANLPCRVAVPCHFGMFAFNTADPRRFRAACSQLGVASCILSPGQRMTLAAG